MVAEVRLTEGEEQSLASKHNVGVEQETTSGREACASFTRSGPERYRESTLPG